VLADGLRARQRSGRRQPRADPLLVTSTDVDKVSGRRDNPTLDLALVDPLAPDKKSKIATLPAPPGGFLVLVR
jgi:hypothetical protein